MTSRFAFGVCFLVWSAAAQAAGPVLSEFVALNQTSLRDADGDSSDWIEIVNQATTATNLLGWHLTDDATRPAKWTFPSTPLHPGEFLVVFASGKNHAVAGRELHTNFRLNDSGEYLALTRPDNTVASEFAPTFPPQGADIAYGHGYAPQASYTLVREGDTARFLVPSNAALGDLWLQPGFDAANWSTGPTPLGFESGGSFATYENLVLADDPLLYWNFDEPGGNALNRVNPELVQDSLVPLGASTRIAHDSLPLGNAASFPGVDNGSRFMANDLSLGTDVVGPWAVEFWVRLTNFTKTIYFIEGAAANGTHNNPGLIEGYNGSRLEIFGGNSGRTGADGPLFTSSGWHHLLFGYLGSAAGDGVTNRHDIYVDGVRVSSQVGDFTGGLSFGAGSLSVGGTLSTGVQVVPGQMDELAVYDLRASGDAAAVSAKLAALATNHYRAVLTTNFGTAFATDLRGSMLNQASSLYVRHEFVLTNAAGINRLTLRLKFDDGVVAWLNGTPILALNAPLNVGFDSAALSNRPSRLAVEFTSFDLSPFASLLTSGTNVLALQGLNTSATDPDFLLAAELTAEATVPDTGYLVPPTPGQPNGVVARRIGPLLRAVTEDPPRPAAGEGLVVTARVDRALADLAGVQLYYRVMFSNEVTVPMLDDGAPPDTRAGDGVFTALIPGEVFTSGQMIRWAVLATDVSNTTSRLPGYFPTNASPQYFGTVALQPGATSNLPILEWFLAPGTEPAARTRPGTRASVFYDGEFHDNVWVHLRGRTAASLDKNPYQFEFNPGHKFRFDRSQPRVDAFALNTTYRDKAYIRPVLGFELFRDAGVACSACFPLHVRRNGQFFSVALFVEIPDRDFLERNGLDPHGALYKAELNGFTVEAQSGYNPAERGFEKKTPDDTDFSDIIAFSQGLARTGDDRTRFVFDYVDLPATVNYLAVCVILQDADRLVTNFYPYRDTLGTGEWTMLPWDLDLSLGQVNNSTDEIQTTQDYPGGDSHPFYATQTMPDYRNPALWNKLIDVLTGTPVFREMYVRRLRTLMDQFLKAPGTPAAELYFEPRINYWRTNLAADVALDKARWASWGENQTLDQALNLIANSYLPGRRVHLFTNHSILRPTYPNNAGIPTAQAPSPLLLFGALDFNPASGNQQEEFFQLLNPASSAVDLSGWHVGGAVDFTFKPGTILPAGGTLHVAKDVAAFRARAVSPKGGEGHFVQGNYQGWLSAWGEVLELRTPAGRLMATTNYAGNPSAAQRALRITEIMYHPSPFPAGSTNDPTPFEYLELRNIGVTPLDLAGVRLTEAVAFDFATGSVPTLAPGARLLVVKDLAAFASRYDTNGLLIAGTYTGSLENQGERLRLLDAVGEEILDFSYNNTWYPVTDGLGFSLVIVDEAAPVSAWDRKENWRPSGQLAGTPGLSDPGPPAFAPVVVNEVLTASTPPAVDVIELFNPSPSTADLGGWFLTDDFNTPMKFRLTNGTLLPPGGFLLLTEAEFNPAGAGFAFGSDGDEVYLFSGDASTNLTGYVHGFAFGAAERDVTFGRYVTSVGEEHLVAQSTNTLGFSNALPRVGPVVISEIQFHPPDLGTNDNLLDEFLELHNPTATEALLFDPAFPTNTWRLRGGVDFDFPTNFALPAGAFALLVGFDPIADPASLAGFRAAYGLSNDLPVLGPYRGKLANAGGALELRKPDAPRPDLTPYVLVERIAFRDSAPWPTGADGTGASLQRRIPLAYGNDPINWLAALPSASANALQGQAPRITSQPLSLSVAGGQTASLSVVASGTAPLRYQWAFNGLSLSGSTNDTLLLTNAQPSQEGEYRVTVLNHAGVALSDVVLLTVRTPPRILTQPVGLTVSPGSNVTFTVAADGTGTLRYQWRFNSIDLPGATTPTYTVTNAQLANHGAYTALVRDDNGEVLSQVAFLAVRVPPVIIAQPQSQTAVERAPVTFRVSLSNAVTFPVGFRWRRGTATLTNIVQNQTTCAFTLAGARLADAGNYTVIITNGAGQSTVSAAAVLTVLADFDADGLPDAWEALYGFNTNTVNNADLDPDGDGLRNRDEYLAGTDPTNASSCLRIEAFSRSASFQFTAVSNHSYTVEYSEALGSNPWLRLFDVPARATNHVHEVRDPSPLAGSRFYRVRTPLAP